MHTDTLCRGEANGISERALPHPPEGFLESFSHGRASGCLRVETEFVRAKRVLLGLLSEQTRRLAPFSPAQRRLVADRRLDQS
jgi:hypothetical protein